MTLDSGHMRALNTAIHSLAVSTSHMKHLADFCVIEAPLVTQVESVIEELKNVRENSNTHV